MRASRLRSFIVPLILALSACGGNESRFVKPVATPVASDAIGGERSKYEDGYLRIFVSSNLDAAGKLMDFGKEDQRPAMLLISARFGKGTIASFSTSTEPEIPVLLYDVQAGKTLSSVVDNALLTEGLLVDPESLSRSPHLQIYVRGVPADKAKWVTDLLKLATAEPLLNVGLSFVPGAAAFSPLSTKLGDMLSDEIKTSNKPWEEKTLLGLRSDEGVQSLHGRQFVVLLNPSTIQLEAPPDLARCDVRKSPTGLCRGKGEPWVPAQAYVRFELDVSDYRSIKDFLGADVSCEADERRWVDYRALLASGQLAKRQTENERYVLARGDLLADVRRLQEEQTRTPYASRLLLGAQRYALLPKPEDAYWQAHFKNRAEQLDGCIRSAAVRGQSPYAAIWDAATQVYVKAPQYPAWGKTLAGNSDPEAAALRAAEDELSKIERLLSTPPLRALDAQSLESLTALSGQLQQMLLPSYEGLIKDQDQSDEPAAGKAERLVAAAARTACQPCRTRLTQRAAELRAIVEVPASLPVPVPASASEPASVSEPAPAPLAASDPPLATLPPATGSN